MSQDSVLRQNIGLNRTTAYHEPCSQGKQPSALLYQSPVFLYKRFGSIKVVRHKPVPVVVVCVDAGTVHAQNFLTD